MENTTARLSEQNKNIMNEIGKHLEEIAIELEVAIMGGRT